MLHSTKKISTFLLFISISLFSFNVEAKSLKKQIKEANQKLALAQIEKQIEAVMAAPAGTQPAAPCQSAPCQSAPAPCTNQALVRKQTTIGMIVKYPSLAPKYLSFGPAVYTCFGSDKGFVDIGVHGIAETEDYFIVTMVPSGRDGNGNVVAVSNETFQVAVPRRMIAELNTPYYEFTVAAPGRVVAAIGTANDGFDPRTGKMSKNLYVNNQGLKTASYYAL